MLLICTSSRAPLGPVSTMRAALCPSNQAIIISSPFGELKWASISSDTAAELKPLQGLDADEPSPLRDRSDARGAAAAERVQHHLVFIRARLDDALEQLHRLLRRVA